MHLLTETVQLTSAAYVLCCIWKAGSRGGWGVKGYTAAHTPCTPCQFLLGFAR
jgi:hypothetical protein